MVTPSCTIPRSAGGDSGPGAILAGRYRLLRRLGEGAMGVVYEAEDLDRGRALAAVKIARPDAPPETAEGYVEEFLLARTFRHPHIAAAFDFGRLSERPYIVMERVAGADFLAAAAGFSCEALCRAAAQVCRALRFLHHRGYAHGDLKPSNVLVAGSPARPQVKLLDLGLAWRDADLAAREARGTLAYLPPEMLDGGLVDARCDLYALGVMLYEAIAGRHPFAGPDRDFLDRVRTSAPAPLPDRPRVTPPPDVWRLVLRLLEKSPDARPASAADVIGELAQAAGLSLPVETPETAQAYVRSLPCLDRERILKYWDSQLRALAESRTAARAVGVLGAWGMGKTRMLEEMTSRAAVEGFRVLPFRAPGRPAQEDEQPLVVAVDDLDRGSGEALAAQLGSAAAPRRLVVFTCEIGRWRGGVQEAFAAAGVSHLVRVFQLGLLSSESAETLIRLATPTRVLPDFIARVKARAKGAPRLLIETLAGVARHRASALAVYPSPAFAAADVGPIPDSLLETVSRRLDLDPEGWSVLQFCALAPAGLPVRLLAELAETSDEAIRKRIPALASKGLIRYCPDDALVQAANEIVAECVKRRLSADSLARIHRLLAERVSKGLERGETFGFDLASAAGLAAAHFMAAGERGAAGRWALRAARQAARAGRSEPCAKFARMALDAGALSVPEQGEAWDMLGDACYQQGQGREAAQARRKALELTPASQPLEERVRRRRTLAQALVLSQQLDQAREAVRQAEALAQGLPPTHEERVLIQCALAEILIERGEYRAAIDLLEKTRTQAENTDDPWTQGETLRLLSMALGYADRRGEAIEVVTRAKALFDQAGDQLKATVAQAIKAWATRGSGELSEARRLYLEVIEDYKKAGAAKALARTYHSLGALHHLQCDWESAIECYERSIRLKRDIGLNVSSTMCNLAIVSVFAAKLGSALRAAQAAVEYAEHGAAATLPDAWIQLAFAAYQIGDLPRAERAARKAEEMLRGGPDSERVDSVLHLLGRCASLRGDFEQAAHHYDEALQRARESGARWRLRGALSGLADLHRLRGDLASALAFAADAAAIEVGDDDAPSAARARIAYGKCLHAAGRTDEAVEQLLQANALAARVRSPLLDAEAAAALAPCHLDRGDLSYFCHCVRQCLDVFDIVLADLQDRDLARVFRQDPRRREVYDLIKQAKERYGLQ